MTRSLLLVLFLSTLTACGGASTTSSDEASDTLQTTQNSDTENSNDNDLGNSENSKEENQPEVLTFSLEPLSGRNNKIGIIYDYRAEGRAYAGLSSMTMSIDSTLTNLGAVTYQDQTLYKRVHSMDFEYENGLTQSISVEMYFNSQGEQISLDSKITILEQPPFPSSAQIGDSGILMKKKTNTNDQTTNTWELLSSSSPENAVFSYQFEQKNSLGNVIMTETQDFTINTNGEVQFVEISGTTTNGVSYFLSSE